MRFMCCLKMAFNLRIPKKLMNSLHNITRERVAALTNHFADAFVREMLHLSMTMVMFMAFEGLTLMPFVIEKSRVIEGIF